MPKMKEKGLGEGVCWVYEADTSAIADAKKSWWTRLKKKINDYNNDDELQAQRDKMGNLTK